MRGPEMPHPVRPHGSGNGFTQEGTITGMLREHINDIMIRWSPKERRGSGYDPVLFLETPEQARKLIYHLRSELDRALREKNRELIAEMEDTLAQVQRLSKRFFRWEEQIAHNLSAQDLVEIKKLPMGM
jgi:hypothetical protein